jgi:circadian clock protein KaiB
VTPPAKYVLRLYVTGLTPRSTRAITVVRDVCEQHLAGRYELEIVDVYQQPARVGRDQIFAIPTLVKCEPAPQRFVIGDMTDRQRLLSGLGLPLEEEKVTLERR